MQYRNVCLERLPILIAVLCGLAGCRSNLEIFDFNKEQFISSVGATSEFPETGKTWIVPTVDMVMEPMSSGTFIMGSLNPRNVNANPWHYVTLSKPFWIGKFEVMQDQYTRVMEFNPSFFQDDHHPVETVDWYDAVRFCLVLTAIEDQAGRLPAGYIYRLPTEAEWEYCARGGREDDVQEDLELFAWYSANSDSKTHIVGLKEPNNYGLYDMLGNVIEWCMDRDGLYETNSEVDPFGPESGKFRVVRGGGWHISGRYCTWTHRYFEDPDTASFYIGFRIVLAPGDVDLLDYSTEF